MCYITDNTDSYNPSLEVVTKYANLLNVMRATVYILHVLSKNACNIIITKATQNRFYIIL